MNLILCSRPCKHQQDGYCCLDGAAVITNAAATPCCYYEADDINDKEIT
ncbi:MAG: hypothetical protein IJ385_06460 [Ruminiclostridium sp.]|nr:hypothetical protein [Ruminiclostridium sp.]